MKNYLLFIALLFSFNVNGQMLQAVKSAIRTHLTNNKNLTHYAGSLNIEDATIDSNGKTITVIGSFEHKGYWTNVQKPFVAKVKVVLDELVVKKLCFYRYQSLLDIWTLECTNGKSSISPLPKKSKKY